MKKITFTILFFLTIIVTSIINAQGAWVQKANFSDGRGNAVCFSIGTKLYIGTGYYTAHMNDLWEWDQNTNAWTQKANLPGAPRLCAVAFSIGTKGYVGTGEINGGLTNDFWEWDQATNIWNRKSDVPGGRRSQATGFSIGTSGYIGTGYADSLNDVMKDFWKWDQATDTWTSIADYGGGKILTASGFVIGDKGYVGTGGYGLTWRKDFWEYDSNTDIWTQKADFGGGLRNWVSAFSIGNKGYMGTGSDYTNCYKDLWQWDQATDNWQQMADIPGSVRYWAISASVGSKGYIGLGVNAELYEYSPASVLTNMDERFDVLDFKIFPNPSSGVFTIDLKNKTLETTICIYDVLGNCVLNKLHAKSSNLEIDLSNQPKGIYFIEVETEKGRINKKIILN